LPTKNTDGSNLENLLGFRVFRQSRPLPPSPCPDCPLEFEPVAEIDVEYPPLEAQVEGGRVLWRETTLKPQNEYTYFVVAYSSYRTPSPESNRVTIFWDDPPIAPTKVTVQSEDKALEIRWEFTPRLVNGKEMGDFSGFNIYRRSEGERFGFFPLNPEPIKENRYLDAVLENGKRYYYEVRAVRNFRGTLIEGPGSAVASGIPEKRTPPSPPTGLVAAIQKEGVALRWNPNPEPDIAGYNVYRREKGESEFTKITPQLITEIYFLDKEADPHKTYFYRLTAVDTSPAKNESEFSQEVEVAP
jgi:fibronectin type 3 domain-containing protein